MRLLHAAIAPLTVLAACATTSVASEPWPISSPRRATPGGEPFRPAAFAAQFATSLDCERAARQLHASSPNDGWKALKACIGRGDFPHLDLLASTFWAEDLRRRPDAPALLGRAIAMQGGSIHRDLALLQERHIHVFSLEDSVSAPELYAGRNIVLRGRINEVRSDGGGVTVKLEEMEVQSAAFEFPVGYGYRSRTQARDSRGALSWSVESGAHRTFRKYDNLSQETGREALLRLSATDPFLEPGREFIIVARFDGVRATSNGNEDEPELIPVLSLISYAEPSALGIY